MSVKTKRALLTLILTISFPFTVPYARRVVSAVLCQSPVQESITGFTLFVCPPRRAFNKLKEVYEEVTDNDKHITNTFVKPALPYLA